MSTIFVLALLVAGTFAATTHHHTHHAHHSTQNHHGHLLGETFQFDRHSNMLIVRTAHTCYLYDVGSAGITNNQELHLMEGKAVALIDAQSGSAVSKADLHSLPNSVTHNCHHHSIIKLN